MKSTDRRTARLVIMVSLQERAEIARAASAMGYAESTYARATLLQHARHALASCGVADVAQNVPIAAMKGIEAASSGGSDTVAKGTKAPAAVGSNAAITGTDVPAYRRITGTEYDTYRAEQRLALREGREFPGDHNAWLAEYRSRPGYVYVPDPPRATSATKKEA